VCISKYWKCDGIIDCIGDAADEVGCNNTRHEFQFPTWMTGISYCQNDESDPIFCMVYDIFIHLMSTFEHIGNAVNKFAETFYTEKHSQHYTKMTALEIQNIGKVAVSYTNYFLKVGAEAILKSVSETVSK